MIPALVDAHVHMGYRKGLSFGQDNYTRENLLDTLNRFAYFGGGGNLPPQKLWARPSPSARVRRAWKTWSSIAAVINIMAASRHLPKQPVRRA